MENFSRKQKEGKDTVHLRYPLVSKVQTEKLMCYRDFQEVIEYLRLTWEEKNELYKTLVDYNE